MIVAYQTCDGTGFHQKCHHPNIPASALELSTPWNCTYCQKGEKCPFLTESLDVLQNLLSDDECSGAEDGIEAAAGLDSDHYEPDVVSESPQLSPRKKRVSYCRPPLYTLTIDSFCGSLFCFLQLN